MADVNKPKPRSGLIAALDVGTTKMCCFIAKSDGTGNMRIVGIGHHISGGMRLGNVVDMDAAEHAIRATVEAAEHMAGENIRQVVVGLSGVTAKSRMIAFETSISGHEIGDADLRRVLDPAGLKDEKPEDHEIIHAIPVGYSLDGHRGIRDPRGMYGEKLGVNMHIISASSGAVRNLSACIARCHLDIEAKVVAPYASALSTLVEDEKNLGVTLVDMGGGTTSIAVFFDGELVHTDAIPAGGQHVTNDIARGLSTPLHHAERMKTLYGSTVPSSSDDHEVIRVPLIGEEESGDTNQVPRSMLVGIIRPRMEEIIEMVGQRLSKAGFDKVAGRRVVLTGGGALLPGVREMAAEILDKQVRFGHPIPIDGLAEAAGGPSFATTLGLLRYGAGYIEDTANGTYRPSDDRAGRVGRIGQWFRENF